MGVPVVGPSRGGPGGLRLKDAKASGCLGEGRPVKASPYTTFSNEKSANCAC